ncbi:MAG TPA: class I SAM-dependent methyltransferase, partial [Lentisphaeria bacterium]|nr:class I SAM-dependent methyltransferase [Lentisphaeria bacterium]
QAQAMLDNLKNLIESLSWQPAGTEWGDYYDFTNYSEEGLSAKKDIVCRFLDDVKPSSLWDLGANNGLFTRLAAERAIPSVAFDIDPAAIEKNYLYLKENRLPCLLPLVCDLCNPSPGLGWANAERDSLAQRGPVDAVLALALIHHLAISNNLPLPKIAEFLASIAKDLLIEFVPKTDSKVKILLATRPDIFPEYDFEHFLAAFSQRFAILKQSPILNSDRIVVHLRRLA